MAKRKRFTPEFKREAVRTMASSDKSPADIARELGIHRNQLYKWKEQFGNGTSPSTANQGHQGGGELARLRRELESVKEERDILKKAVVYFAREIHA